MRIGGEVEGSLGGLTGRVVLVERLGGTSHVHMDVGAHRVMVAVAGELLPEVGADISIEMPAERVHLFGTDGRRYRK